MIRAHIVVHVDLGEVAAEPLRCDHETGATSFRIVDTATSQVWINGTAEDFQRFADDMQRLADVVRSGVLAGVS